MKLSSGFRYKKFAEIEKMQKDIHALGDELKFNLAGLYQNEMEITEEMVLEQMKRCQGMINRALDVSIDIQERLNHLMTHVDNDPNAK